MEEKDFFEIFKEKFFDFLDRLLSDGNKKSESTESSIDFNDEEKEVLDEVTDYLKTYDAKRKQLDESGLEPTEWLNQQVEETAVELFPDATQQDIDIFKEAVAKGMEQRAIDLSKMAKDEIKPIVEAMENEDDMKGGEK